MEGQKSRMDSKKVGNAVVTKAQRAAAETRKETKSGISKQN